MLSWASDCWEELPTSAAAGSPAGRENTSEPTENMVLKLGMFIVGQRAAKASGRPITLPRALWGGPGAPVLRGPKHLLDVEKLV